MPAGQDMRFVTLGNEKAVLRYGGDNGPGQLHFYAKIDGSLHSIRVNDVLTTGAWLHVAGTYDGSTMRLYLNGAEQTGAVSVSGAVGAGDGIHLSWSGGDGALDGLLDDVRVYNRALSAAEIAGLADGKHPETSIATTTLGAPLDVHGDLTLNSGTLDVSEDNYTIEVGGDLIRNGGLFAARGGSVTFDGSSAQILDTDTITFHDLTVAKGTTLDLGPATALPRRRRPDQQRRPKAEQGGGRQQHRLPAHHGCQRHAGQLPWSGGRPGDRRHGQHDRDGLGQPIVPQRQRGRPALLRARSHGAAGGHGPLLLHRGGAERPGQRHVGGLPQQRDKQKVGQEAGVYERGGSGDGQYVQVTDVDEYSPFALSDSHLHEWRRYWLYFPFVPQH